MEFGLDDLVPWGRQLNEYACIFQLTPEHLGRKTLGCADGPSSFNAEMTRRGGSVISCDPLYAFSGEIEARSLETNRELIEKLRRNPDGYDWNYFADSEAEPASKRFRSFSRISKSARLKAVTCRTRCRACPSPLALSTWRFVRFSSSCGPNGTQSPFT
jgi:hypothetical protein